MPTWRLSDRLRKALSFAGVTKEEMARELQVSERTINNWLQERNPIRYAYVLLWAQKTGVSLDWILDDDTVHLGDDSIHPDDEPVNSPISPVSPESP